MLDSPRFDPQAYKETTRRQWQEAAKAWNDWGPTLRTWLGPATEAMLDMAGVAKGSRVLDVAAGAGDQTLLAAERVGPEGHVLATDISSAILEFAAANARAAGCAHVETMIADGEELEVAAQSFDAAISRVGLIYFPDQHRALANVLRALRPGGRFAAMVYSTPEANGFFSTPVAIIRERANLPPPAKGQPGPFSLGSAGVLAEALERAGFRDVEERVMTAPLKLPSAADCVRFERESFGALHQMLAGLDEAGRAGVWAEIETSLGAYQNGSGFEGPCELIIAAGTK
jgi:ubiquinone/menaquinone biosynthesis C-methylase UbiE